MEPHVRNFPLLPKKKDSIIDRADRLAYRLTELAKDLDTFEMVSTLISTEVDSLTDYAWKLAIELKAIRKEVPEFDTFCTNQENR